MPRIVMLLAACGLASYISLSLSRTIARPPAVGAAGVPATVGGWTVLGAARSLPTLNQPAGLAVDGRGNVYVADTGNHRILEIAPNGRLLAHFGDAGLGPQGASGLAVSAGGTVYAADSFHRAIQVYSPAHRRVATWPVTIPGATATGLAVAVGRGGNVIVAFAPESRCTIPYGPPICATSYIVQRRAGYPPRAGRLLGQFRYSMPLTPWGAPQSVVTKLAVAADLAGDIDVAAGGTDPCYKDCRVFHLLVEHGPGGRVLGHWGADELDPTASWTAVAIGGRGNVFVADELGHRIEKRQPAGRIAARWPVGNLFPSPLECSREPLADWQTLCSGGAPAGVAVGRTGTVYVSDPGSGRILVLSSGGRLLAQWGPGGAAPGRLWFPASVALDAWGQLWVDDMANGRVQTLGTDGRFHVRFAVPHAGTGMGLDRQGNVYIGQQLGQQVEQDVVISKFSPTGKLLARWGNLGLADPPSGIAVAPNGDIMVVAVFLYPPPSQLQMNGANILRLSPAGKQLGLIHLGYFGPGSGIAVDARENSTIALGTPPHVERYSSSGALLASWGAPKPSLPAEVVPNPAGITLDAAGDVYIADTPQNVVREYAADGRLMQVWGSAGSYAGQFHHPGGIAVAPNGTIYVSDTENHRVQRLLP